MHSWNRLPSFKSAANHGLNPFGSTSLSSVPTQDSKIYMVQFPKTRSSPPNRSMICGKLSYEKELKHRWEHLRTAGGETEGSGAGGFLNVIDTLRTWFASDEIANYIWDLRNFPTWTSSQLSIQNNSTLHSSIVRCTLKMSLPNHCLIV